ncbi:FadR/GntR family transcriptional regulator [Streptomyces niveiscabiei]|uniref:FadR/GntR family transcriptional regulator n=1 Tax=Streptomyces niveiscabiei TaxID=164115 RepID=UPI0029B0F073|nr:FCD domain-containing protein [Streptomyces niveiscabiei]MDX3383145.1 FCD domain-containing protein [Streptomyces niveiscabiei]
MPLGPVRPSPLVEQATERLRERIVAGEWAVGARLPGETSLAAALGVGRSTVREALRGLAGEGFVRARQGAGVFVVSAEPAGEEWASRLRKAAVRDVYEVRMAVETHAARLAAERRTEGDLVVIEGALAARRAAASGDDRAFVEADIAFHAAVVAAAHNPVLVGLFGDFVPVLREGLVELLALTRVREGDAGVGDLAHEALVRAVRAGDGAGAAEIVRGELGDPFGG